MEFFIKASHFSKWNKSFFWWKYEDEHYSTLSQTELDIFGTLSALSYLSYIIHTHSLHQPALLPGSGKFRYFAHNGKQCLLRRKLVALLLSYLEKRNGQVFFLNFWQKKGYFCCTHIEEAVPLFFFLPQDLIWKVYAQKVITQFFSTKSRFFLLNAGICLRKWRKSLPGTWQQW